MSDHDASEASIDAPQQPRSLTLAQILCFTQLLSVLKRDILLVQPVNVTTGMEEVSLVLPPSITEFVADAVGVPESSISGFWTRLREDISDLPEQTLREHEEGLFREHGWKHVEQLYLNLAPSNTSTSASDVTVADETIPASTIGTSERATSPSRRRSGSTPLESDAPPKHLRLGPLKGWGIKRDGVNMSAVEYAQKHWSEFRDEYPEMLLPAILPDIDDQ
ncbi:hypothetical protein B0H13DRAFT_2304112 [Mycena leptocephala]|nr:hypothetical protein B0H13DRAFT_2304112 [Mycena leptocephala]